MGMTCVLSDWEQAEMAHHWRCGWTTRELAQFYGISERTVLRYLRREALRADSRPARAKVE